MMNPLLTEALLPPFSAIKPEHVLPAVKQALQNCRAMVEKVTSSNQDYTWDNFIQPISEVDEQFSRVWSPVSHLNSVANSNELREVYEACLPLLSDYSTWVGQYKPLYQAYKILKGSAEYKNLTQPQKKAIDNALRDFELSGIGLPEAEQKRYGEIVAKLSELASKYSNNVLDATMGWSKLVTDVTQLSGLPDNALAAAKQKAIDKGQEGWLLTLDMPSYLAVMTYCDNRDLRFQIYEAYSTRASDQGPHAGKWDNTDIIREILILRSELAKVLGFETYAEKSLATKMASSPAAVVEFLTNLAIKAKPQGEKELSTLKRFAYEFFGASELMPWDITYYSEKQKQHLYAISDEDLRPYFPEDKVLSGLFEVIKRVFGITAKQRHNVDVWCSDVKFYDLYDSNEQLKGSFYLDLYAREHKRGGAWMDDCIGQMRFSDGHLQKPVAYLTCNFSRPVDNQPALFTHEEVTTLFHEFGHGLHHMLTEIEVSAVSGINGVPWDAVELPSQFLENWCWEPEALNFISGHYQTGETLPQSMLNKMLQAKNYQAALFILRQLEFGLFDFSLHTEKNPDLFKVLNHVRHQVTVVPIVEWSRFPHSFSHIFAGGYAAGYYSYLWAEVLSADAFSRFSEEGIFNAKTGQDFLHAILSKGGSDDPMQLFQRFRGREPRLDALLHHYGIDA